MTVPEATAPETAAMPMDISNADDRAQRLAYLLKGVIRELTGGWGVWCSDTGVLYATRDRTITQEELEDGLSRTLYADSPTALVERLRQEMHLEAGRKVDRPAGL
ncbi:hypothetical protein [Actinomadura rugatobispora]|uniref:Uncharacterized protein n=1 Tax=Actinomadura rugatobispora TaxID=1994 RepID=A0ABW0ZNM1_9ACTN|nr:hypothetical protein GCM10010200_036830 [Actinomadura rugatobispora]